MQIYRSEDLNVLFWPAIQMPSLEAERIRSLRLETYIKTLHLSRSATMLVEFTGPISSSTYQAYSLTPDGRILKSDSLPPTLIHAFRKEAAPVELPLSGTRYYHH
ncbi:MAG: hypothetical protein K6L73_10685 [Cellvibrionaceae bacterium]